MNIIINFLTSYVELYNNKSVFSISAKIEKQHRNKIRFYEECRKAGERGVANQMMLRHA
jgi:hypothetical protein